MTKVFVNKRKVITTASDEVTEEVVTEAIRLHISKLVKNYVESEDMYLSQHEVLKMPKKDSWKPDNRLVFNYAKYIVDTFTGYQLGVPVKIKHEDENVNEFVADFRKINDMEDSEFELAKMSSVFGHAFIYVYQDEYKQTRATYNSPINMFIVHDNSIEERPLFAVRYTFNENSQTGIGQVITNDEVIDATFSTGGTVKFGERTQHIYNSLPVVELIENEERQSIFESVKTLINALNKAASEKANDVDYFADAYLKVLGVELQDEDTSQIRENRIFNLWKNGDGPLPEVNFLEKPSSDTTQENLISLLKESIFAISMVANMSEADFGNSSGTALAFKLQAMDNLARMKDRKLQSAFNRLYQIVFSVPLTAVYEDAWTGLTYTFTRNVPRNILEEAQIVGQLSGQVSEETKLSVLSIIDDPQKEIERMEKEEEAMGDLEVRLEKQKIYSDAEIDESQKVIADVDQ